MQRFQKLEIKFAKEVHLEGDLELKMDVSVQLAEIVYLFACFRFELKPTLTLEGKINVSLDVTFSKTSGFCLDEHGVKNLSTETQINAGVKCTGTLTVGLTLNPTFVLISEWIGSAGITASIKVRLKACLPYDYIAEYPDDMHLCYANDKRIEELLDNSQETEKSVKWDGNIPGCIDGTITAIFEFNASASLFKSDKLKLDFNFNIEKDIEKFYYSLKYHEFGLGTCPHQMIVYEIQAQDESGCPAAFADVEVEHDGKTSSYKADSNGLAEILLLNGNNKVTVSYPSCKPFTKDYDVKIKVSADKGSKQIELSGEQKDILLDPTETTGTSTECTGNSDRIFCHRTRNR